MTIELYMKIQIRTCFFSSIQTMLNTPQVTFSNANSHTHTIDSHGGMTSQPTWDNGLGQYKVDTIHSEERSSANATQIVSTDMGNMIARGDTLDRIPIFVNPNDLNQTGNPTSEGNQEQQTVAGSNALNHDGTSTRSNDYKYQYNSSQNIVTSGSDSQQQSQIKLLDNSTIQQQVTFANDDV